MVSETCLDSWNQHLDYLSPALVIFALADDEVPNNVKTAVADDLLAVSSYEDLDNFPTVKIFVIY